MHKKNQQFESYIIQRKMLVNVDKISILYVRKKTE
jgi:hypothetical protein